MDLRLANSALSERWHARPISTRLPISKSAIFGAGVVSAEEYPKVISAAGLDVQLSAKLRVISYRSEFYALAARSSQPISL